MIKDNFMKLEIHFAHGGTEKVQIKPAVTGEFLFGSLGGNLNLWIGISFATLIEFMELIMNMVMVWLRRKVDDPKKEDEQDMNSAKITYELST